MARIQYRVQPDALQSVIDDPERGVLSLAGNHGGLSLITGEVYESNVVQGMLAIETEHGTVYVDRDNEITVSEDDGRTLSDRNAESLYTLNTLLTSFLSDEFGWQTGDDDDTADDRDEGLNDAVHATGAALDDLLQEFPAGGDHE